MQDGVLPENETQYQQTWLLREEIASGTIKYGYVTKILKFSDFQI